MSRNTIIPNNDDGDDDGCNYLEVGYLRSKYDIRRSKTCVLVKCLMMMYITDHHTCAQNCVTATDENRMSMVLNKNDVIIVSPRRIG